MKNSNKIRRLLSLFISTIFLMTLFCVSGTIVQAEEGEENEEIIYYSDNGTVLTDPYNSDVCYDAEGNIIPCPTQSDSSEEEAENSTDEKPVPPGQLVRRGLSGPIVGIGDGYVVIETNFGIVKIYTDAEIDESMIGQRVAVKLGKTERNRVTNEGSEETGGNSDNTSDNTSGDGSDNVSANYYREATAEQFKIIPSKSTKEHRWGTVESTDEGCFFVDDEGNQIPTECGNSTDVIGLVDDDSDNGTSNLLRTEKTSRIQARIQERLLQAEEEGDEKVVLRLQQQLERYEAKQIERQERKEERATVRAEKDQNKGQGNQDNQGKQGQGNNQGNQNQDNQDKKGNQDNQGNQGNQDHGNQGGGKGKDK